jgi:hypothetical protein
MVVAVAVVDETSSGERTGELTLEFLTEQVTVRELIRSRVYQEVTEHNARLVLDGSRTFRGLVQPLLEERVLNGERSPRAQRRVDWEAQYQRALEAFGRNGFLLLVDDQQVLDLDAEVVLRPDSTVTFLKLVPLVGG